MANIKLITATPIKKIMIAAILVREILLTLYNSTPTTKLSSDHATLTIGDDNPLPGGLANGVGNLSPETPCIK